MRSRIYRFDKSPLEYNLKFICTYVHIVLTNLIFLSDFFSIFFTETIYQHLMIMTNANLEAY